MPTLFGARTDHFELTATGGPLETLATVTAASKVPVAQDRADANNANGDIIESAYFGNTNGDLYEISNTYQLKSGSSLVLNELKLGELVVGIVATDISVTTNNGDDLPTIEVSGLAGSDAIVAPEDLRNTFALPALTITGAYFAQELGFTVDTGKLTGSSFSATISLADTPDGEGEIIAHGVSGGTMEIGADFVGITDDPEWTVGDDFTATQDPGQDEPQADFETGSGTAAGIITRDESA